MMYLKVLIQERVEEGRKRYEGRKDKLMDSDIFGRLADALKEVEKQVFEVSTIKPNNITNDLVSDKIELLRSFQIV